MVLSVAPTASRETGDRQANEESRMARAATCVSMPRPAHAEMEAPCPATGRHSSGSCSRTRFFFFFFTLPSRCRRSGTMQAALLRRERTSRQRRGYDTNPPYRTHCPCPVETRGLEGVEGRRERYEPGDGPTRLHFPCRDAIIFTWALTPTCRVSRGGSQGSCQYVRYEYFTWYGIPTRCSRLHVSVFLLH